MNRIVLIICMVLVSNVVISQHRVDRDPTYSIHNYKHPKKAAYARKHNLNKPVQLETFISNSNGDYKHPFNKSVATKKGGFYTRKVEKSTVSYKHPLGL